MKKLFKKSEPIPVDVKGHSLKCPVCDNTTFWVKGAQLNTAAASFFGLDWANRTATCFVCSNCTHILWFVGE